MKPLKFIHITKCAGTTIENLGIENNISWGRFHEEEYGWWHEIFKIKPSRLKSKYDWFVVVRNPYERLISEFYCKWGTPIKNKHLIKRSKFNQILKRNIKNRNLLSGYNDFHYLEQYKYIDNASTIHILHFENLQREFNALMQKYDLNITLTKDRKDNKCAYTKKFTVSSFKPELIEMINEVYDKDFKMFGYKKIIPDYNKK